MKAYVTVYNNEEEPTPETSRRSLEAIREIEGVVMADGFIGDLSITAIIEADEFDAFHRIIETIEAVPTTSVSMVALVRPY